MQVSLETVRRDLTALEAEGLIRRSYGRAYAVETAAYESNLPYRETAQFDEKQRIASEAVRHLESAETVFIDEGFLPQLLARQLPDRRLRVVTASLPVATILAARESMSVHLLGGLVRASTLGTVGHPTMVMLDRFVIDLAYLGANAISRERGLTTPDPAVAEVKATAMRVSRRKIFIGDSTKFGAASF